MSQLNQGIGLPEGKLIIIGGHEEKSQDRERLIIEEVARAAAKTRLVVITVATQLPDELWSEYRDAFKGLGVKQVDLLDARTREDADAAENVAKLTDGAVLFFTGGDQLRITSQLGGSAVFRRMQAIYEKGGVICGTSAGAAAMPETMLVAGPGDASGRVASLEMAPGLGLVRGVVIDSHFAERGRMGRLLGAVARNPKNLGLGIDENTAVVLENRGEGQKFRVLGEGAVYVMDGSRIHYSSLSERQSEGVLTICGVTLHVLGHGDEYDLASRRPQPAGDAARREAAAGT